jgi:hypothetical protein
MSPCYFLQYGVMRKCISLLKKGFKRRWVYHLSCLQYFYSLILKCVGEKRHLRHQSINVGHRTGGAQDFLMDYTQGERA